MAKKSSIAKTKRLNAKPVLKARIKNRCNRCGRARSYMRRFGICRICFREMAHQGLIPGVTKSSW